MKGKPYLDGSYAVRGQLDSGKVALTQYDPVHDISAEFMDFLPHIPRGYFRREDFISCGKLRAANGLVPAASHSCWTKTMVVLVIPCLFSSGIINSHTSPRCEPAQCRHATKGWIFWTDWELNNNSVSNMWIGTRPWTEGTALKIQPSKPTTCLSVAYIGTRWYPF